MYDGKTQLFIDNPLDRYLLNSTTMDEYVRGEDGSLVFHISKESPGKDLEANWLPAPDGPFYLVMRLYGPEPAALSGDWSPPALEKATAPAASAPPPRPPHPPTKRSRTSSAGPTSTWRCTTSSTRPR